VAAYVESLVQEEPMSRLPVIALVSLVSSVAFAADPPATAPTAPTTPTVDVGVKATVKAAPVTVTTPTAGSPEEAVLESLKMLKAGNADKWMDTWCEPTRCSNNDQREDMKNYALKRAMADAGSCLQGAKDDAIVVKRIDGNPATDTRIKVFIDCGSPISTPATLLKVDGKWKIESQSW
jgi:hypothetical protein